MSIREDKNVGSLPVPQGSRIQILTTGFRPPKILISFFFNLFFFFHPTPLWPVWGQTYYRVFQVHPDFPLVTCLWWIPIRHLPVHTYLILIRCLDSNNFLGSSSQFIIIITYWFFLKPNFHPINNVMALIRLNYKVLTCK